MFFDICYNNTSCGVININYNELYVIFEASCDIVSLKISRLYLAKDDTKILLGVLQPKNNRYVLTKKIPISLYKKYKIDDDFVAFIECEQDNSHINDENLRKIFSDSIIKKSYGNFDIYMFLYNPHEKFLFDFCFSLCFFNEYDNQKYFGIKTDKNGNILV